MLFAEAMLAVICVIVIFSNIPLIALVIFVSMLLVLAVFVMMMLIIALVTHLMVRLVLAVSIMVLLIALALLNTRMHTRTRGLEVG